MSMMEAPIASIPAHPAHLPRSAPAIPGSPVRTRGNAALAYQETLMYARILVAHDGSETADRAFDAALQIASETGAELQPLYVVDIPVMAFDAPGYDPSLLLDAFRSEGERVTASALDQMTKRGVKGKPRIVEVEPPGEDIAQRIDRAAREWHAELIVMGTHGRRGVTRLVLGSVAERLLRLAACPVLMVPARVGGAPAAAAGAKTEEETQ
jgi:nucleotide-binding universal stress UspA family protein